MTGKWYSWAFLFLIVNLVAMKVLSDLSISTTKEKDSIPIFDDDVPFDIEHSFDGEHYIYRNSYKIQAKPTTKIILVDASDKSSVKTEDLESFRQLLVNNDFYRIRIHSQLFNESSPFVIASIPAVRTIPSVIVDRNSFF